ncbi:hypothetical protein BJ508DRAFT_325990 [Ascobolus immersus RN42]|uniref:MARVEL domain-containing protein n=1 Tax=Ascobolus immersus RN42 TaxID=1160509 RepID=A0A3N4ICV4_ASCIM|nr:hypothetical protein BJ508DRAFT_325990 [Ascobolus immersus RN42]
MGLLSRMRWESGSTPKSHLIANAVTRALISIVSLVVIGLYARDVDFARKNGQSVDGRWGFAVAVAVLSVIACLVHLVPAIRSRMLFPLDLVLFFLWVVLFGIFGKLFIGRNCHGNGSCNRMKIAVWFDLAGMLLWLLSGVMGAINWRRDKVSGAPAMSRV